MIFSVVLFVLSSQLACFASQQRPLSPRASERQLFCKNYDEADFETIINGKEECKTKFNFDASKMLGSGTSGTVYLGHTRTTPRKPVAFKVVNIYSNDPGKFSQLESLKKEIRLLSVLNHKNIMQFLGAFSLQEQSESRGCPVKRFVFFLEFMENGTLEKYSRLCPEYEEDLLMDNVRKVMRGVVSALVYLHGRNIIHRDIKPANIMIDTDYEGKLIDFGYSTEPSMEPVSPEARCGSPLYLAPEVVDYKTPCGVKADIWAFGITLWSLFDNPLPGHQNWRYHDLTLRLMTRNPNRPETASAVGNLPGFDADLDEVLRQCTLSDQNERASAQDLADSNFFKTQ
mgnify:CR=1 FL=1